MVFVAATQGMHLDLVALVARGQGSRDRGGMKQWEDREV